MYVWLYYFLAAFVLVRVYVMGDIIYVGYDLNWCSG